MSDEELTASERELINKLTQTRDQLQSLVKKQERSDGNLDKEMELSNLRRQVMELKEENQYLKETMHTWKQRMNTIITNIK